MDTSTSCPSRMIRAVLACNPIRRLMASEVLPLALASRYFPNRMRAMIMAELSKYTCSRVTSPGKNITATL